MNETTSQELIEAQTNGGSSTVDIQESIHSDIEPMPQNSYFVDEENQLPIIIIGPDNEEIKPEDLIVPPDGGWGWVVVFAAFMSNAIMDGTINSSGLLLLSKDENGNSNVSTSQASWIIGICVGFNLLSGPFVSLFANQFGFRITAIVGSCLSSLGLILSWFFCRDGKANVDALYVCYGVLAGIGFGFIYVPAVVAVGFYFQKRRALATGIAVCGSGAGTFIFPPLVSMMINSPELRWHRTLPILAGLLLFTVVFGMLYRPLKPQSQKKASFSTEVTIPISNAEVLRADSMAAELRMKIAGQSQITLETLDTAYKNPKIDDRTASVSMVSGDVPGPEAGRARNDSIIDSLIVPMEHPQSLHSVPVIKSKPKGRRSEPALLEGKPDFHVSSSPQGADLSEDEATDVRPTQATTYVSALDRENDDNDKIEKDKSLTLTDDVTTSEDLDVRTRNTSVSSQGTRKTLRLRTSSLVKESSSENQVTITLLLPDSEEDVTESRVYRVADKQTLNSPFDINSIFYPGTLSNIMDTDEDAGLAIEAVPVSPEALEEIHEASKKKKCKISCHCHVLRKMLDFSLLRSYTFLLMAISGAINVLGFFIPFIYLAAYVEEIGVVRNKDGSLTKGKYTKEEASLLISVIGITNTFGRIVVGAVADKIGKHILIVGNMALTVCGLITIGVVFITDYSLLVLYAAMFGFCVACFVSLRPIILVQLLGLSKLTNAFGLMLLFQGFSAMVGSPMAGALRAATDGYLWSFVLAGSMITLSGILLYPLNALNRWETRRRARAEFAKNLADMNPEDYDD